MSGLDIKITDANYINNIGNGYDVDAQIYITASGITDQTTMDAVNDVVSELKIKSLWSKITLMYLFGGDTADKCKFNLKDIATYQLTTLTDDVILNGLSLPLLSVKTPSPSHYLSTGFVGDLAYVTDGHLSLFNSDTETNIITVALDDTASSTTGNGKMVTRSFAGGGVQWGVGIQETPMVSSPSPIKTRGLLMGSQIGADINVYHDDALSYTKARVSSPTTPTGALTIGCLNASYPSSMTLQMVSTGASFDATEVGYFNTIIQNFATALNR